MPTEINDSAHQRWGTWQTFLIWKNSSCQVTSLQGKESLSPRIPAPARQVTKASSHRDSSCWSRTLDGTARKPRLGPWRALPNAGVTVRERLHAVPAGARSAKYPKYYPRLKVVKVVKTREPQELSEPRGAQGDVTRRGGCPGWGPGTKGQSQKEGNPVVGRLG